MDFDSFTDEELVDRSLSAPDGDLRSFDELVRRHRSTLVANCRYLTGSSIDSQDLAQEVFVKAYFGLSAFEGRSRFLTWIRKIKVNHCLSFLEKWKGRSFVDVADPAVEAREEMRVPHHSERTDAAARDLRLIREVLDQMSETLRVPLIMRDLDKLSYQEIADALCIGLSAVKMRIKRAREDFRSRFEGRPGPEVQSAP